MIVDLFAGCGGWDVGARLAGLPDPIGFELDPAACATRVAAQMPTVRADLDGYPPRGSIVGLIASPPCTDFSTAGKQAGRDGVSGHLVDVPLAWALALRPEWLAWEQVPPVLPIWEQHAYVLEQHGYRCWTGIVCAADFGVPQTRRRAVLLARRDRRPCPPMPTHCETGGMFTQRWVSMADALGWGRLKPAPTMASVSGGGPHGIDGGSGTRAVLVAEQQRGEWVIQTQNTAGWGRKDPKPYQRPLDEPSPTLDSFAGSKWKFTVDRRQSGAPIVDVTGTPAPTVTGTALAKGVWKVEASWAYDRPATMIAGDSRCWPPGHKINADDIDRLGGGEAAERYGDRAGTEAIRLTVRDALILQSFPPDFPVQGTRTAQFRQIGNAVPPRLAQVLLEAVSGP